jgi:diguanylate cyclase (GGDEF)-like protein
VTPTPGVPLPAAPPALTVPVSADLLRALLTMAILDARTGVLTFPAWRAQGARPLGRLPRPGSRRRARRPARPRCRRLRRPEPHLGHLAADQLLARIAALLQNMPPGVLVGRYGGDEFVVILPHTGLRDAQQVAEYVRAGVADLRVAVTGPYGHTVGHAGATVSIGVAAHPGPMPVSEPDIALTALFWAADAALYAAKDAGGNRVRSAPVRPSRLDRGRPDRA